MIKRTTLLFLTLLCFTIGYSQDSAAPEPTRQAEDVISVYSDSYTSIATNTNPGWGQATVMSEVDFDGNKIMKYAGLNYQGLEYTSSDVSAMEYVHLDYYTSDTTAFQFFLIAGGENAYDVAATDGITNGEWVSLDIPLSFFSDAGRDLTAAIQFKTVGNGTLYLDNLYFWKEPTATGTDTSLSDLTLDGTTIDGFNSLASSYEIALPSGTTVVPTVAISTTDEMATSTITAATSLPGQTIITVTAQDGTTTSTITISFLVNPSASPVPNHDAENVISVYSDSYASIATNTNPGWGQATVMSEVDFDGNKIMKYAGLNYQGLEYTSSDVSAMEYVHLDYYTSDTTAFQFFLIAGGENAYDVAATDGITNGEWVSLDIPLSFFSDAGRDLTAAIQFKTVGNGTLYLDNLYFWKEADAVSSNENLIQNPSAEYYTSNTADNSDAFDMTPNSKIIDNSGAEITSPYKYTSENANGWYNGDLETYIANTYGSNEQPGTTGDGAYDDSGTRTRGLKLASADRRIYQLVQVEQGASYTFSIDTRSEAETTTKPEIFILNNQITSETSIDSDLGSSSDVDGYLEITNDFNTSKGSADNNTFTTSTVNFVASTNEVVVYVRSLGSSDSSTEFFADNLSLMKNVILSTNNIDTNSFYLTPNPATDLVTVVSDATVDQTEIYDMTGNRVSSVGGNTVNVSSLASGIYLVKITSGSSVTVKKLVKQ